MAFLLMSGFLKFLHRGRLGWFGYGIVWYGIYIMYVGIFAVWVRWDGMGWGRKEERVGGFLQT